MLKIIKVGGKLIEDEATLASLCDSLAAMSRAGEQLMLVHGGGALAGKLASRMGVETRMHEGRRITDAATLEITVMAYAGLANKKTVAALQARGVNACGLSGCDLRAVTSHRRPVKDIDWGFVGDIDSVNADALKALLAAGIMPVISPITCSPEGQLLNTNADSVASAVASAMAGVTEVELTFCLDKPGVLRDVDNDESVIPVINPDTFAALKAEGAIHSGMIPKLDNAFATIASGVASVRITDAAHLDGGTVISQQ